MTETAPRTPVRKRPRLTVHWHAFVTHFPVSLFLVSFAFQMVHFFFAQNCLEEVTVVTLTGGTASMIPVVVTGWFTWKRYFGGRLSMVFRRKIYVGFAMLVLGLALTAWRIAFYSSHEEMSLLEHIVYTALVSALVLGAVVEGYYGGGLRPSRPRVQPNRAGVGTPDS